MRRRSMRSIWTMFAVFLLLFILNMGVTAVGTATQSMWVLIEAWSFILSAALIRRYKLPGRRQIVLALALALLASLGHALIYGNPLSAALSFLLTATAAIACFSTFGCYP